VNNYFAQAFNGTNRIIELSVPERITDLPNETDIENIIQKVRSNKLTQASFNINKQQLIPHALTGGEIKHKEYLKELDITKIELSNGATIYLKPTTFKKVPSVLKLEAWAVIPKQVLTNYHQQNI
jgi:hypothetical protein